MLCGHFFLRRKPLLSHVECIADWHSNIFLQTLNILNNISWSSPYLATNDISCDPYFKNYNLVTSELNIYLQEMQERMYIIVRSGGIERESYKSSERGNVCPKDT